MSLFAELKEKFADKFAEFTGSTIPSDPLEKQITELVEKATSHGLIAPDWTLNLAVVDFTNINIYLHSSRTLKALRRSFVKPNTKVQLLTLVLLETCVKNCAEEFHTQLAASELWGDIVRLAGDSNIARVDGEIRDKLLGLVEDFARALRPVRFQVDYAGLLERGLDFPTRAAEDVVPILTPPGSHAIALATGGPAAQAPALAASGPPDAGGRVPDDSLAGVDEQDRAAIQAALAELEAEERAAQEAERVAAEAEAQERRLQLEEEQRLQQQQQQAQLHTSQHPHQHPQHYIPPQPVPATEAQAAALLLAASETATAAPTRTAPAGGGVDEPLAAQPSPRPLGGRDVIDSAGNLVEQQQEAGEQQANQSVEESTAKMLETASNSTLLLSEMLASVPDTEPFAVREPYVAEVADTCVRLRSRLERALGTLSDESLMAAALSQHEELSRVLARYEELLATAESLAPTRPRKAASVAHSHRAYRTDVGVPHPPPSQLEQTDPGMAVPPGQRVAQTAAVFAATLKEKMTGAFDKLMAAAAAAAARNTGQPGAATPFLSEGGPAANTVHTGMVGGPPGAPEDSAFTLLDEDEDEDAHEGTSLLTKRTPVPTVLPAYQPPPPSYTEALDEPAYQPPPPPYQQPPPPEYTPQQAQRATPVWPPPVAPAVPAAPAAPAVPAADLINFDEESSATPAPAPTATAAAVPVADDGAMSPSHMWAHFATTALEASEPSLAATAAADDDLLSGLNIHTPAPAPGPMAAGLANAPGAAPSPGPVSRGVSNTDQLVEALDRLVSQDSTGNSPVSGAGGQAGGGAPLAHAHGAEGLP